MKSTQYAPQESSTVFHPILSTGGSFSRILLKPASGRPVRIGHRRGPGSHSVFGPIYCHSLATSVQSRHASSRLISCRPVRSTIRSPGLCVLPDGAVTCRPQRSKLVFSFRLIPLLLTYSSGRRLHTLPYIQARRVCG